jgi:hypothetical protein
VRVLLVTGCGCTRILDAAEKVQTIELVIPLAVRPMDWLGPVFVPAKPTATTRRFEYQREKIRCGNDELRVFREVLPQPEHFLKEPDATVSAPGIKEGP